MNVLPFNPAPAGPRENSLLSTPSGSAPAEGSPNGSFESALVNSTPAPAPTTLTSSKVASQQVKSQLSLGRPTRTAGTASSLDAGGPAGTDRRSGATRLTGTALAPRNSKPSTSSVESGGAESMAFAGTDSGSGTEVNGEGVADGQTRKPQTVSNDEAANPATVLGAQSPPALVDLTQIVWGGVVQSFNPGNEVLENAGQGDPTATSNPFSQLVGQQKAANSSIGQTLVMSPSPSPSAFGKPVPANTIQLVGTTEGTANGESVAKPSANVMAAPAPVANESEPKVLVPSLGVPEQAAADRKISLTSALPQSSLGGPTSDQPKTRIPSNQVQATLLNSNQPSQVQATLLNSNQPGQVQATLLNSNQPGQVQATLLSSTQSPIAKPDGGGVEALPSVASTESGALENPLHGEMAFDRSVFARPARLAGTVGLTSSRGLVRSDSTRQGGAVLSGKSPADASIALSDGAILASSVLGQSNLTNPIGSGFEPKPQAGGILSVVEDSPLARSRMLETAATTVPSGEVPNVSAAHPAVRLAKGKNTIPLTIESQKGFDAIPQWDSKTISNAGGAGDVGRQGIPNAASGAPGIPTAAENAGSIANKPILTGSELAQAAVLSGTPGLVRNEISKSTTPVSKNTQDQGASLAPISGTLPPARIDGSETKSSGQTDQGLSMKGETSALREPSSTKSKNTQSRAASLAPAAGTWPTAGNVGSETDNASQIDQALALTGRASTPPEPSSASSIVTDTSGIFEKPHSSPAAPSSVKSASRVVTDSGNNRALSQPVILAEPTPLREKKPQTAGNVPSKSISHPENHPVRPSVLAAAVSPGLQINAETGASVPATQELGQLTKLPNGAEEKTPVESFQTQTSTSGDHSSNFGSRENSDATLDTAPEVIVSIRDEKAEAKPAATSYRDAARDAGREIKKEAAEPQAAAATRFQGVGASDAGGTVDAKQGNAMALSAKSETGNGDIGTNLPISGKNDSFPNRLAGDLRAVESREVRVEPLTNERRQPVLQAGSQLGPDGVKNVERSSLDSSAVGRVQAGRLVEEVRSAIENFRAVGSSEWEVKVRADQDTQLNLKLKMHENQLTVQATLERGNWETVAPRWNELRATLAERGVDLKPLESGTGQSFNSGQSSNSHLGSNGSNQKETPSPFTGLEELLARNGAVPRDSVKPSGPASPKKSRSNAILETWA